MSKREDKLVQEIYDEVNNILKHEMGKYSARSAGFKALRAFCYKLDEAEVARAERSQVANPGETSRWLVTFVNGQQKILRLTGKHHTWFYAKQLLEQHIKTWGEFEAVRAATSEEVEGASEYVFAPDIADPALSD